MNKIYQTQTDEINKVYQTQADEMNNKVNMQNMQNERQALHRCK